MMMVMSAAPVRGAPAPRTSTIPGPLTPAASAALLPVYEYSSRWVQLG